MKNFEQFIKESFDFEAIQTLMGILKKNLEPFDEKIVEDSIRWHKERVDAIKKFKEDNKELQRKDTWGYYDKLWGIAGGKGIYNLLQYGWSPRIEAKIKKDEEQKAEARNYKIASQLQKAGITEVLDTKVVRNSGGFNGIFEVVTTTGSKFVYIDTIFAGGYNIQRAHLRVLVKIK